MIDCLHIRVSGRVQGVGFRYAMQAKACELRLNGWVRNLPDRRVEAFCAGTKEELDHMLAWCRVGPRMARVEEVDYEYEKAEQSQYSGFRIRG